MKPQLAKAGDLPLGEDWVYEVKWDGYRCIATVKNGEVWLESRSGKTDFNKKFAHIVEALRRLPDCILDGELVVRDEKDNTSFERMDEKENATYVVFDCIESKGVNLRKGGVLERKVIADTLVMMAWSRHIDSSQVFSDGEALLKWADEQAIEGIVAKRKNSRYCDGSRNGDWVKVKLRKEQEFAVLGWLPGEGSRSGVAGSLMLGVANGAGFTYCGRVGTGGTVKDWQRHAEHAPTTHHATLDMRKATPAEQREVVLVDPYVVQVRFQKWTEDGCLWHPSVVGVREDKSAYECWRET